MKWMGCRKCGHIHTDGFFSGEAADFLFAVGQGMQQVHVSEQERWIASMLIDRVAAPREPFSDPAPTWLDVGFGSGALVMTAEEYGYDTVGLDLRDANVNELIDLGCDARKETIEDFTAFMCPNGAEPARPYNVISMLDSLEHMPFPGAALASAHKLLRFDGALIVSCPNMDTAVWRAMDSANANPYWVEIEHYHNFTRKRLAALLEDHGFSPVSYHVSPRYKSCMEIIAMKKETDRP